MGKLVRDTQEIEVLMQRLENYLEEKKKHDTARDEYTGYSWGWYGRDLVERMEKSAEELCKELDALIEKRVLEILRDKNLIH